MKEKTPWLFPELVVRSNLRTGATPSCPWEVSARMISLARAEKCRKSLIHYCSSMSECEVDMFDCIPPVKHTTSGYMLFTAHIPI